jgi:hypothetical protein
VAEDQFVIGRSQQESAQSGTRRIILKEASNIGSGPETAHQ